jgi:hypothetical protein
MGCTGIIEDSALHQAEDRASADENPSRAAEDPGAGLGVAARGAVDGQASGDDRANASAHFGYATLGQRCTGGESGTWLVLSRSAASCSQHAQAIDAEMAESTLRIRLGDDDALSTRVSLCEANGACQSVDVDVSLEGRADGDAGELTLRLGATAQTHPFRLTTCDYDGIVPPVFGQTRAHGVELREVALYQGVKVSLFQAGSLVQSRNAPVVAGRSALVRAFVQPAADFAAREVVARLTLTDAEGSRAIDTRGVPLLSTDGDLATTFNFDVPGELIREDTSFSVELFEIEACVPRAERVLSSRAPAEGLAKLAAAGGGDAFHLVVVPVRFLGDASGRLPNTSDARMQQLRDFLFALYPVADLRVTVREPMDFSGLIDASGGGWSKLLNACLRQRGADNPDPRTYYYCMFEPALDFRSYCGAGCVVGLGPVPGAGDVFNRASIGLGFNGTALDTCAHEVGHSLGRPHAPCGGVDGAEPDFPYRGGGIGVWGYDLVTRTLKNPAETSDIMGYCDPQWISDHNFTRLFERMSSVFSRPELPRVREPFLSVVVEPDGSMSKGYVSRMVEPSGVDATCVARAADGSALAETRCVFVPVTHVEGGIIYMREPPPASVAVEIEGFGRLTL